MYVLLEFLSLDERLDVFRESLQHLVRRQHMQQLHPIDHSRAQDDLPENEINMKSMDSQTAKLMTYCVHSKTNTSCGKWMTN